MADCGLARRHYVYTINTAIALTNDAKGIKVKLLEGKAYGRVSIKRKKYMHAGWQKCI